jgi:hypothetical protein
MSAYCTGCTGSTLHVWRSYCTPRFHDPSDHLLPVAGVRKGVEWTTTTNTQAGVQSGRKRRAPLFFARPTRALRAEGDDGRNSSIFVLGEILKGNR